LRRESLLRRGVEPRRQPHGRLKRVVLLAHPMAAAAVVAVNKMAALIDADRHRRLERALRRDLRRNDKTTNGERRRLRRLGGPGVGGIRRSAGRRQAPETRVRGLEPRLDDFERTCQDGAGGDADSGKKNLACLHTMGKSKAAKVADGGATDPRY